jgi:hypothetical protein
VLPVTMGVDGLADMLGGLMNAGTYRALVIERGWSLDQYGSWVRDTVRRHIGAD